MNGVIASNLYKYIKHSRIKPMLSSILDAMFRDAKIIINPGILN